MNTYTITHPAEALSVIAIDPMGYAGADRLYIGLTNHMDAKKYNIMYIVDMSRTTGNLVKTEAYQGLPGARRLFVGDIDEDGRALLAEVIAGDKFAAMFLNKVA